MGLITLESPIGVRLRLTDFQRRRYNFNTWMKRDVVLSSMRWRSRHFERE